MNFTNLNNVKLKKDFIIMSIIIIAPFAFYIHVLAPKTQVWDNVLFRMDAGYFENVRNYLWIYSYKILTILIITLWFATCKNQWRFFLFIPLGYEIHRLIGFLNDRYSYTDDFGFNHSFLIITLYITFVFLLSKYLKYYQTNSIKSDLNNEIYQLMNELSIFERNDFIQVKKQLKILNKEKKSMNTKDYLVRLIMLRDSLSK